MHSVLEQRKQWQKQYIYIGKTDLFCNSMELYGNFTNYEPADTCLIETEHIAAFISKFGHRLSVVSTVLTVSDLKLLMYKAEIEYKMLRATFREMLLS